MMTMMSKQTEALKMAIEWIESVHWKPTNSAAVIQACKEALAEAENESNSQPVTFNGKDYMEGFNAGKMFAELEHTAQEPVAYRFKVEVEDNHWIYNFCQYPDDKNNQKLEPLYTHPATWQSLSDDELNKIADKCYTLQTSFSDYEFNEFEFARAIEAKLKEKNYG